MCEFEAQFSIHMNELKNFVEERFEKNPIWVSNPNINAFWISYIAIQMLRSPWMLDVAQKIWSSIFTIIAHFLMK